MADAEKAVAANQTGLARLLLTRALTAAPNDGIVRTLYARIVLVGGDAGRAEALLRQARGQHAPDTLVLPSLFEAMVQQHENQKLLDEFADPGADAKGDVAADVLNGRAMALAALDRASDAAATMDRSLSLRRDAAGLVTRARIAAQQNNASLAMHLTEEALKLEPRNHHALQEKLALLIRSNDTNGALDFSEQILKLYPADIGTRNRRIAILLNLHQDARAKADMDFIIATFKNSMIARYYQAFQLAQAHNDLAAWRIAQSLPRDFTQNSPTAAMEVAQMAIGSGDVETGASILSGAVSKSPNVLDLRLRLASLRLNQNSPEIALDVLKPVKDSPDTRVVGLFARAYLKLGRTGDALNAIRKIENTDPKLAVTLLANEKRTPEVMDAIGWSKLQMKDTVGAISDLTDAHTHEPDNGEITFHLVRALDAGGNRVAAKAMLRTLLSSSAGFDDLAAARQLSAVWR